jgi:hypothetical protein
MELEKRILPVKSSHYPMAHTRADGAPVSMGWNRSSYTTVGFDWLVKREKSARIRAICG